MYRWLIFTIIVLSITACATVGGEGVYSPIGIPLEISVNTWGEVSFEVATGIKIPTAIGTFEANVIIDPSREYNKEGVLTIRFDGVDRFYDLHGEDFNVSFEAGNYEKIGISKAGKNILLELKRAKASVAAPTNAPVVATARPTTAVSQNQTNQVNVTASYPSNAEFNNVSSIWNVNDIPALDLLKPGRRSYNVSASPSDKLLWPYYWCASTKDVLKDNLRYFSVEFLVDGRKVSNSQVYQYSDEFTNWKCENWVTLLSEWRSGTVVQLDIRYTFSADVNDGYTTYPAGTYTYSLTVSVR